MSYVWACYIAVFGILTIYAARLVLRSRAIAAKVLAQEQNDPT
jgi:hypothetical protein